LNGMDIAPDDSFLLVAQNNLSGTNATVHKLDLASGAMSNISYTVESGELGPWDIVIGANGIAFVTTQGSLPFYESGWTPLRQIDLATGAVSTKTTFDNGFNHGNVWHNSQLCRSADAARFYILEGDRAVLTYDVQADAFENWTPNPDNMDHLAAAISRDGSLVATPFPTFGWTAIDSAADFSYVRTLNEL